jgi:hypothetical protein
MDWHWEMHWHFQTEANFEMVSAWVTQWLREIDM